jgi:hypothetical protein
VAGCEIRRRHAKTLGVYAVATCSGRAYLLRSGDCQIGWHVCIRQPKHHLAKGDATAPSITIAIEPNGRLSSHERAALPRTHFAGALRALRCAQRVESSYWVLTLNYSSGPSTPDLQDIDITHRGSPQ